MTLQNIRLAIAAGSALFAVVVGAQPGYGQAVSTALAQKAPEAVEIAGIADSRGYVRIIVQFASPVGPNQITPDPATLAPIKQQIAATQNAIIATHFGNAAAPTPGRGFARGLRRFQVTPAFAINVTKAELEALAADPRVVRIHYNRAVPPTLIQSVPLIGMTGAYSLGATGQGQAVAILDTGVQSNHEFLTGKVVSEACFSNAGGFGGNVTLCPGGGSTQTGVGAANSETPQCINGSTELCVHGTHVAGIAAGKNTSQGGGEPANGVAKEAQIVAVQIFTRFNSAGDCGGNAPCVLSYVDDQIDALDWVLQNAVNLPGGVKTAAVNLSLGGGSFTSACDSDPAKPSIDNLKAAGVATVIASGNGSSVNAVSSPGCISTAITVGSTDKSDVISSFSNMAPMVDLMAPGSSILSSVAVVPHSTTTYQFFYGTSMATPHVAGTFAAIRTICPTKTVDEIEAALKSTGQPITDNRPGGTQTKPRIRVDSALAALNCVSGALAVAPATNMYSSGPQGGPFSPSSFNYTLSASAGSVNFSVSGLPSWLSASATSGTVTTSGTTVTFTINASANSLSTATYGATITFTNTTNGQGNQTRHASLTVNSASPALQVTPATNIASNGNQGGPFSPSSFNYQLSATIGSLNYSITGTPNWLNVSSTSGTLTTSPTTITFTVNASANSLTPGVYNATITFTNTTNDQGSTFRESTLNVSPGSGAQPLSQTWVSGTGSDSNPCTVALPCLTYQFAHGMTLAGGEINCLDPGGFGAVTITKSISIVCDYTEGGVPAASGVTGFIINAPAGSTITLKGQDIECAGTGLHGINLLGAGVFLRVHKVQIRNCRAGNGIIVAPSAGTAKVFVADSYITDNGAGVNNAGILVKPTGGASVNLSVTRVHLENNTNGIFADGSGGGGASNVNVKDSFMGHSSNSGIVIWSAGPVFRGLVENSIINFNANTGAAVAGASATLRLGGNTISNNLTGVTALISGTLQSFKNNIVSANGADGSPMNPFPGPGGQSLQ